MKERKLFAGPRLKRLRLQLKLTQTKMARELGVSASYLNLMERNQRPVTAQVLIRLVETYELDLGVFASGPDQRTVLALKEAASEPVLQSLDMNEVDIKELLEVHPLGAQALVRLHGAYRHLSHSHAGLAERVSDDPVAANGTVRPSDLVQEIVQEQEGYFAEIEDAANLFRGEIRFENEGTYRQLVARLQQLHSIRVRIMPTDVMRTNKRRYDRHSRRVLLSELLNLRERSFQLAVQIAHLELRELFDELCLDTRIIAAGYEAAEGLKEELANRFALAVLLPYEAFLEHAVSCKYDLERLGRWFNCSMEMTMRRLAMMRKPGASGPPVFLMRIDAAGNVLERGGAKKFSFARYGNLCPKWRLPVEGLHSRLGFDLVELPDNSQFLSIAAIIDQRDPFATPCTYQQILVLGFPVMHALETAYAKFVPRDERTTINEIGPGCRLCERENCLQRSLPSSLARPDAEAAFKNPALIAGKWKA